MKRPVLLTFLILIAILVGLGVYWSIDMGEIHEVRLAEVELSDLHGDINTNGKVEAEKVHELRSPFAGLCRRIHAREGVLLKAGDPVLEIDDSSARADLAVARAELAAAEVEQRNVRRGPPPEELNAAEAEVVRLRTEVESARRILDTNEKLLSRNAISRFEMEESRRALARGEQALTAAVTRVNDLLKRYDQADARRVESRVEAAKAKVSFLESTISRSVLRAPANGTLFQFEVKDGAYLNAGDLVGLFADLTRLRVRAFVDEPEMSRIAEGNEVSIRWDARPQEAWKGVVIRLPAQVVARGTRSVAEVICSISSPQQTLVPNINVDVEIETSQGPRISALPRECVIPEGKDHFVFVVQEGRARKRKVEVGRSTATLAEILSGLTVGERVIIPDNSTITEGTKVRVTGP